MRGGLGGTDKEIKEHAFAKKSVMVERQKKAEVLMGQEWMD